MKKFLLTIIFFIILLSTVKAENDKEIFKFDWQTTSNYISSDSFSSEIFTNYKQGYIRSYKFLNNNESNNYYETKLINYDSKGNVKKSITLSNTQIYDITTDEEYIYAISSSYINNQQIYKILKLKEDLTIIKEKELIIEDDENFSQLTLLKLLSINTFYTQNEKIIFISNNYIKITDKDFTNITNLEINESNIKTYLPTYYIISESNSEDNYHIGYNKKNNIEVYSGYKDEDNNTQSTDDDTELGLLEIYEEGVLKKSRTYQDYNCLFNPIIVNNYIIVSALKITYANNTEEYKSDLLIIDMSLNIIQKISNDEYYLGFTTKDSSFATISAKKTTENLCTNKTTSEECLAINNKVYYIPFNIETKISGKGEIISPTLSRDGEEITLTITPAEKYLLTNIKVKDEYGNEIKLNNNKFIMPNSNVTIEATFGVDNPGTKDIALMMILLLLIIGVIIYLKMNKKLSWLKG